MGLVKSLAFTAALLLLTSCQLSYLAKNAYYQVKLLNSKQSVKQSLLDPEISQEHKRKLALAEEAKLFAEQHLNLNKTSNYESFVKLNKPYVTWTVSAADKWSLVPYQWHFPIIGKVPYKGFFDELSAQEEAKKLQSKGYDVYVRGVSAYSTLGWFADPILSSMLNYSDYDLVNLVIHETLHATLFIKSNVEFNEQLATFVGNQGAEMFFSIKEGSDSPTLNAAKHESEDERLFSDFISSEIKTLETWYQSVPFKEREETKKASRLEEIQTNFNLKVKPFLKTKSFSKFSQQKLNNAVILIYKTYMNDLSSFKKVFEKFDQQWIPFLEFCKSLEKEKDPRTAFLNYAKSSEN
jgi:predicted aminopeptidase